MLLPTMTPEEIYAEMTKDANDLWAAINARYVPEFAKIIRRAQRFQQALDENRILFISLVSDSVRMYSATNAHAANRYILSLASEAVFASIAPGSSTEELYNSCQLPKQILN